jgi:hypothetical protein
VLVDGTIVRWWPHLAKRFTGMIAVGDRVEVTGQTVTFDDRVTGVQASVITNLGTKTKRLNDDTPPPVLPPDGILRTVRGTVQRFTTARKGEIDGMILDGDRIVSWPPALEKRFTPILSKGDKVEVTGRLKRTPRGDSVLEAHSITNILSKAVRKVDTVTPLPPPVPVRKDTVVRGIVREFTKNAGGAIDGLLLRPDDGPLELRRGTRSK